MPRKRNEDIAAAVRKAARDSLLESGYAATTYTVLSERTGIPRATIQHYFPSKYILANELMSDVAGLAQRRAEGIVGDDTRPIAKHYPSGQISFGMYYATPGMRQFFLDVASSRDLQYAVSPDYRWPLFSDLDIDDEDERSRVSDAWVFANGGCFDAHYVCLKQGRTPELSFAVRETFRIAAAATGMPDAEFGDIVARHTMDNETLLSIGAELVGQLSRCV